MVTGDSNDSRSPIEGAKDLLAATAVYLQLVFSLFPGVITHPHIRGSIEATLEWLGAGPTEDECWRRLPQLQALLGKALRDSFQRLPPKYDWRRIAQEFSQLVHDRAVNWGEGVAYGWLAERFECARIGLPEDMPYHAHVGIGHHAGRQAVEEDGLLRDASYFKARADRLMESMAVLRDEIKARGEDESRAELQRLSTMGENVAALARTSIVTFYSFVECFVNSVGEDFALRHPKTPTQDVDILRGRHGRRYLSIEKKMEKLPQVIRGDGSRPLILTDSNQIRQPFAAFIAEVKATRDTASHFSPQKGRIWLSPQDWLHKAESAQSVCLGVAREFWQACYPTRPPPLYLHRLDADRYELEASKRLAAEDGR